MNKIEILEELKKNLDEILKEPMEKDEMSNGNLYEYERGYELDLEEIAAISTLIAENKELKERNKRQQENLKITNKKIAAQRGQLMMLNKAYIPKSKVKEVIEEVKEDENPSISSFQEYAQEYAIDKLQSLLGKE